MYITYKQTFVKIKLKQQQLARSFLVLFFKWSEITSKLMYALIWKIDGTCHYVNQSRAEEYLPTHSLAQISIFYKAFYYLWSLFKIRFNSAWSIRCDRVDNLKIRYSFQLSFLFRTICRFFLCPFVFIPFTSVS